MEQIYLFYKIVAEGEVR